MPKSAISVRAVPARASKTETIRERFNLFGEKLAPFAQRVSFTPALVILLVVASYFIGSLRTEVTYLKKLQGSNATTANVLSTAATPAPQAGAPQTPAPAASVPPLALDDHVRGNRNAKVLLIEYSDFECPYCKTFHPTLQQAVNAYGDNVAWVYRHFPLGFHANAQKEAEAAECVAELGGNEKFWEFSDKLFERTTSNGTGFALDKLAPLAAEIGVDTTAFQTCLDSGKYTEKVKKHMAEGTAAGVTGTPGTFVVKADGSSTLIPGALPLEMVKQAIDKALQ